MKVSRGDQLPGTLIELQRLMLPLSSILLAILRAVKIKAAYEEAVKGHRGAVGVTVGEQTLMIDAPVSSVYVAVVV